MAIGGHQACYRLKRCGVCATDTALELARERIDGIDDKSSPFGPMDTFSWDLLGFSLHSLGSG